MSWTLPLANRRATVRLGRALGASIAPGDLLVLTGGLGAGKTFLARSICRGAGVPEAERVTSPTFSLVVEHRGRVRVAHADLYRVEQEDELPPLGLPELRAAGAVLLVEWGEAWLEALGYDALLVQVDAESAIRSACLEPRGPRSERLLAAARSRFG